MRLTHSLTTLLAAFVLALNMQAQKVQGYVHQQSASADYVWPIDARILQNLDNWQDRKFGVLFHWGIYSVPGIVESWSICSEDVDWITRPEEMTYEEYKQWYFGLKDQFNPVRFNPDQWAEIMHDAGMKYVIFTTKHHDGFCMFDSRHTDFSIAHGPFRNNPRKDVACHVFDAFRKKNFMIGCYFSKPDWHCPWFWSPNFATPLYHDGNIWFTAHKDGHTLYALYIPQNGEPMPETLRWTGNVPKGKMTLLANGKRVSYQTNGQQVTVRLPEHLPAEPLALRFQKAD